MSIARLKIKNGKKRRSKGREETRKVHGLGHGRKLDKINMEAIAGVVGLNAWRRRLTAAEDQRQKFSERGEKKIRKV